jgi:YfiH family protein
MIVTSELLGGFPGLTFGLSTRLDGLSPEPYGMNISFNVGDDESNVKRNRALFFERIGVVPDRTAFAGQIHSGSVVVVRTPGRYPDCDGLVTGIKKIYCCISVADCVPIFLFDPERRVIAAVHAGWRGTAAAIARRAVSVMREQFRSNPSNIHGFIGPGAGPCCYQVGQEVASKFPQRFHSNNGDRLTIDLKGINASQLMEAGVEEHRIERSPDCTICTTHLHSYRRDGKRSGRMMGVIGMD